MVKQHPVTKRFMSDADYNRLVEQESKPKRGGSRPGAGRSTVEGTKRKLTIILPDEKWEEIESLVTQGDYRSLADYFRQQELQKL